MFENAGFIAWAAENAVLVVGHEGTNHKKKEAAKEPASDGDDKDSKDGKDDGAMGEEPTPSANAPVVASADGCLLYPGITCAEHEKVAEDAKETGTPKLAFKGWPTSFMVGPDGTFEKHTSDRAPKTCMDALTAYQKQFKIKITGKKYLGFVTAMSDGDKAVEAGKWKDALVAYAKIDAEGKKLSALRAELPARIEAMNAKIAEAFAKAKDGEGDATAKFKEIQAMRATLSTKLTVGALPVVAEIDAWLKANPAPPPAK